MWFIAYLDGASNIQLRGFETALQGRSFKGGISFSSSNLGLAKAKASMIVNELYLAKYSLTVEKDEVAA